MLKFLKVVLFLMCSTSYADSIYRDQIANIKEADQPLVELQTEAWRSQMLHWAYDFSFSEMIPYEVVYLAAELHQRVQLKKDIKNDHRHYFSACYIIALKVLYNHNNIADILKQLPFVSKDRVIALELDICELLRWHLYYPIPHTYLSIFERHMIESLPPQMVKLTINMAKYIADHSLYYTRSTMTNYEVAMSAFAQAVSRSQIPTSSKQSMYAAVNEIVN